MDESRILTDDESYQRRSEQASSIGPKTIDICAEPGCPRVANWGPHCDHHRQPAGPRLVAAQLTRDDIATLQAQVEADAAPLFLIAMNWLARQQMTRLGVSLPELAADIERIRGELGEPA